jgi:hypothetical protein
VLQLLLRTGIGTIAAWDQQLVDRLLGGIDPSQYRLISPADGPARSTLVVLSRPDGTSAQRHRQLTGAHVDTAYRGRQPAPVSASFQHPGTHRPGP